MQQLLKRIQNSYEALPQAQRSVAEYIVSHYQEIPFQSVTTMAKEIGVSDTTIIKYCMQLGFTGFGDFKRKITDYVQSQASWYNQLEKSLDEIEAQDSYSKVYRTELNNIKNTVANPINRQSYDKLLSMLDQAENIYVLGFRSSAFPAQFLALGLGQQGYRTHSITPGIGDYHETVCRIGAKDLLISFCYSRYAKESIHMIQTAVRAGAPHAAFTDSPLSPSAALADCIFQCSVRAYSNTPSLTSAFTLINTILTGCAQRHPEQAKKHLRDLEHFISESGFYYTVLPQEPD